MTTQNKTILIAVYGTLREGFWNYNTYLRQRAKFIKDEMLPGFSMYGGGIPHIVKNEEDKDGIYVEIHEVPASILPTLDSLEGYSEGRKDNTYERMSVKTSVGDAYIYARGSYATSAYGTSKHKVPEGTYSGKKRDAILAMVAEGNKPY